MIIYKLSVGVHFGRQVIYFLIIVASLCDGNIIALFKGQKTGSGKGAIVQGYMQKYRVGMELQFGNDTELRKDGQSEDREMGPGWRWGTSTVWKWEQSKSNQGQETQQRHYTVENLGPYTL